MPKAVKGSIRDPFEVSRFQFQFATEQNLFANTQSNQQRFSQFLGRVKEGGEGRDFLTAFATEFSASGRRAVETATLEKFGPKNFDKKFTPTREQLDNIGRRPDERTPIERDEDRAKERRQEAIATRRRFLAGPSRVKSKLNLSQVGGRLFLLGQGRDGSRLNG